MKTPESSLSSTLIFRITISAIFGLMLSGWIQTAPAIPLTGANGRTVEFAGIKAAGPKGLLVQIKEGDEVIALTWDKFDVEKIKSQSPEIGAAYIKALEGETIELNLGTLAPKPEEKKMEPLAGTAQFSEDRGYYEVNLRPGSDAGFKSGKIGILMPEGGDPKGILLISRGQDGRSIPYLPRSTGAGPWGSFQTKQNFAVMAYEFSGVEPFKAPPYIFADKGSGEAVLQAIDAVSEKSGKKLSELPIAIYGAGVLGAAFAYNFAQWKPDRVIAAVAAKGAFYAVPPTPESVKVPLLIIWGEYDAEPNSWNATHTHGEILGNHVDLKPNWIYAMEPRGQNDESPIVYFFGKTFLEEMIEARMSDEGLIDFDRSKGWVGDLKTNEISKMADPEAVIPSTQTWLPGADFGEMWKQFVTGQLDPSAGGAGPGQ